MAANMAANTYGGQQGGRYSWRTTWRPILMAANMATNIQGANMAVLEKVPLFPVHPLHDEAVVGEEDPPAHVLLQLASL